MLEFSTRIEVKLLMQAGSDAMILTAARASSQPDEIARILSDNPHEEKVIRSLLRHKHGTPFEHGLMTHYVEAPIFVWREHHRHRIGWSYSEESGRYRELRPKFWIPHPDRPVIKPARFRAMRPTFDPATDDQRQSIGTAQLAAYTEAWEQYTALLDQGVASEVARSVLPVAIFSRGITTCNPRSMMAFLELRTHEPEAAFPSYPQAEIEQLARQYETTLEKYWPITYKYFNEFGRVAP